MNGRSIDTFALAWVYDRGKREAMAFDERAYLYPTLGISWVLQQSGYLSCNAYVNVTKLLPTAGYNFA